MSIQRLLLGGFAASVLCLQACGGSAVADPSTPDGSIMTNVQALQKNDISAYVDNVLNSEQKAKIAAEWDAKRKGTPPSDMEKEMFAGQMQAVVSGEFSEQYLPIIEGQLAAIDTEQISQSIGFFGGMLLGSPDLDEQQKKDLGAIVAGLSEWVKTSDIKNPEKVKKALKSIQTTAQKLDIKTADQALALSFDQVLDKGDVIFAGVKDVLNIYGISIDKALDSVSIDSVVAAGDVTNVTVSYEIFGTKLKATNALKLIGGKWVESTMAAKLEEAFAGM